MSDRPNSLNELSVVRSEDGRTLTIDGLTPGSGVTIDKHGRVTETLTVVGLGNGPDNKEARQRFH